jgi:alkylated DNA repair protein alkB family protein 8
MLDKKKNKVQRKQAKALKIANKDYAVEQVEPGTSRCLFICNAGLMTGASRESLLEVLSPFGSIERIILLPGKSFSFVVYSNKLEAQEAIHKVNSSDGENDVILVCINQVPLGKEETWPDVYPPGCTLYNQFISQDYHQKLLDFFMSEFKEVDEKESLKNRQVKHYGYEFNYVTNDIDYDVPLQESIPEICKQLLDQLVSQNCIPCAGDQLTVNLYQPGQGIPPHVDSHSCCTGKQNLIQDLIT